MNELRKEFEALPDIRVILQKSDSIFFDNESNKYFDYANKQDKVIWLNGAWWAYQEQYKKIEAYRNDDKINSISDNGEQE